MLIIGGQYNSAPGSITTGSAGVLQLNSTGAVKVDGSAVTQPVSGTVTANQGGSNWSVNLAQMNGVALGSPTNYGTAPGAIAVQGVNAFVTNSVAVTGTFWQATQPISGAVSQTGAPWNMQGDIAQGTADSGNPVKCGGITQTGHPTATSLGQRVAASFDKEGRQLVQGAARLNKGKTHTVISTTTETTVVAAGGTNIFNDLYGLVISNSSATTTTVTIRDSTAGTIQFMFVVPANDVRGLMIPVDSAVPQTTANTAWTATLSPAVTSIDFTALYVSNL
jgi:hypothetical protein